MMKMDRAAGLMLYELCMENMLYCIDFSDLIEDLGLDFDLVSEYFRGARDLPEDHLLRFARVCRKEPARLRQLIEQKYKNQAWLERKQEERDRAQQQRAANRQRSRELEEWKKNRVLTAGEKIAAELKEYGIDRTYGAKGYSEADYYPLKFIMRYLERREDLPRLEGLVQAAADKDLVYKDSSALMWAAGSQRADEIMRMLQGRPGFIAAHIHDRWLEGQTALHLAAYGGDDRLGAVRLLIEWGADVNAQDDFLWTPLHCAAERNGHNDRVWELLVEHGAIYSKNSNGDMPYDIQNRLDAIDAW